MQRLTFFFLTCCFLLTACKKESFLETKSTQSLIQPNSKAALEANSNLIDAATKAELDIDDSISILSLLNSKRSKNTINDERTAAFPDQCGNSVTYNSCYYGYEIWNDPSFLNINFNFSNHIIGTRTDCRGRTCEYYVIPNILVDLYDKDQNLLSSLTLDNSVITSTTKSFKLDLQNLISCNVKCIRLRGSFIIMKSCVKINCYGVSQTFVCKVGTICINSCQQYCIQECPIACPSINSISLDKTSVCGAGNVNGFVDINNSDSSLINTTWSSDGNTITGRTASFYMSNNTCEPITKNIHVTVTCKSDNSILSEQDFIVVVNPKLDLSININTIICNATLNVNCSNVTNITWSQGGRTGVGKVAALDNFLSGPITYYVTAFGCTYSTSIFAPSCNNTTFCQPCFSIPSSSTSETHGDQLLNFNIDACFGTYATWTYKGIDYNGSNVNIPIEKPLNEFEEQFVFVKLSCLNGQLSGIQIKKINTYRN